MPPSRRPRKPPSSKSAAPAPSNPFAERWVRSTATAARRSNTPSKNAFRDSRLAERNRGLSDADRYLVRLQRERTQRSHRSNRFNLLDDDDDDLPRTRPVSLVEPRNNNGAHVKRHDDDGGDDDDDVFAESEDDGDDDLFTKKDVPDGDASDADDGQSVDSDDEDQPRTKREIMHEVMLKSKMHKAERQREKFEGDEQTQALDKQLNGILNMLHDVSADTLKEKRTSKLSLRLKASKNKEDVLFPDEKDEKNLDDSNGLSKNAQSFEYEKVYQMLAKDTRAKTSDRLKTDEELAKDERDRLVEMERKRKSRMTSINEDEEDEDDVPDKQKKKRARRESAEDVDGSFAADLEDDDDAVDDDDDDDDDEEDDCVEEEYEQNGSACADGNGDGTSGRKTSGDGVNGTGEENCGAVDCGDEAKSFWRKYNQEDIVASAKVTREVPFMFSKCPGNAADLVAIFDATTVAQRDTIVERICKCFAISLNSGVNRRKLEEFTRTLLFRIERLCEVDRELITVALEEQDVLLKHVHSLGSSFEREISAWARSRIVERYHALMSSNGPLGQVWKVSDVLLLRAVGSLFPGSDLRHTIMTPLAMLLGEALSLSRMHCVYDVGLGTIISMALMEVIGERKGFVPELVRFVTAVVGAGGTDSHGKNDDVGDGELHAAVGRVFATIRGGDENEEDRCALSVSDCVRLQDEKDMESETTKRIVKRVWRAGQGIAAALFNEWLPHADLLLGRLTACAMHDKTLQSWLDDRVAGAYQGRCALTLYTKGEGPVRRMLNPRLHASETGVFRKRGNGARRGCVDDLAGAATRVRRALRKETRGLARDVRRDAARNAQVHLEQEKSRRERVDRRDKEVRAFFEHQQSTWRQAEKKQNKLSGKWG